MVEIKKHWYEENPELLNFINKMRNTDEIEKEDDLKPIICTCKNCHATTEINKDDEYKTKFFRCSECGYVMGPVKRAVPEAHIPLRNNDYVRTEKTKIFHPIKWIKELVNR